MQRNQRIGLLVAALAIIAAAVVIAVSSGGGSGRSGPHTDNFVVRVAGGKPQGGIANLVAHHGDTIDLSVNSDVTDEIHVHGYDLHKTLQNGHAHFRFAATIEGVFVIELESRSEQIASLQVRP